MDSGMLTWLGMGLREIEAGVSIIGWKHQEFPQFYLFLKNSFQIKSEFPGKVSTRLQETTVPWKESSRTHVNSQLELYYVQS